jgi:hypothetical protein
MVLCSRDSIPLYLRLFRVVRSKCPGITRAFASTGAGRPTTASGLTRPMCMGREPYESTVSLENAFARPWFRLLQHYNDIRPWRVRRAPSPSNHYLNSPHIYLITWRKKTPLLHSKTRSMRKAFEFAVSAQRWIFKDFRGSPRMSIARAR